MQKKLSKWEEIAKLSVIVSNRSSLSNPDWDFVYDMVREHPQEVREMLEDHHTIFYDRYFRRYFDVYDNEPALFLKYSFIPQLINRLPETEIKILAIDVNVDTSNKAKTHVNVSLCISYSGSFSFEAEMTSYMSGMDLESITPLKGVVSRSTHVPYFANPFENGYMRSNGILRQRGYYELLNMIDEVYDMMHMIVKNPSFALGLYTIVYDEARSADEKTEYGKIPPNLITHYNAIEWAHKLVKEKFNMWLRHPPHLIESLQNVIMLEPKLFENKYN